MTTVNKAYTKEYQDDLIRRFREEDDIKARDELVFSNDKFIHKVARQIFKKIGAVVSYEDVYQESVVGFLVALNSYDMERGVKFLTYAYYQMRNHCNKVMYDNMHVVRLPTTPIKKRVIWSAGTIRKKLRKEGKEFTLENVAAALGTDAESLKETFQLLQTMNNRISTPSRDSSTDPTDKDAVQDSIFYRMYDDSPFRSEDYSDPHSRLYLKELYELTQVFKNRLEQREQDIFDYRVLELADSKTLQELADEWDITPERVRQVQGDLEKAFKLYSLNHIINRRLG